MSYPCTSCGACCKRIKNAVEQIGGDNPLDLLYFPYKWDENGVCEHLNPQNQCSIYQDRPLICKVDELADLLEKKPFEIPRAEFYRQNIKACNLMMDEDNIPDHYRIISKIT